MVGVRVVTAVAPPALCCVAGRELRVVVNTNDPDYEDIYSIESYGDSMAMEQSIHLTPAANQNDGTSHTQTHTLKGIAINFPRVR